MSSRQFSHELHLLASSLSEASQKLKALATTSRSAGRKVFTLSEIRENGEALAILARREHQTRRLREELIPSLQFGEPAWDILLDLFAHTIVGKAVHKTSAQIAAHCPPTTALRYIDILEDEGLVKHDKCEKDARVVLLQLTDAGVVSVGSYLMNVGGFAAE